MKRLILIRSLLCLGMAALSLRAAAAELPQRESICLNGVWQAIAVSSRDAVIPQGEWGEVRVPFCYGAYEDQHFNMPPGMTADNGAVWFSRSLPVPSEWADGRRVRINYQAIFEAHAIFVNGKPVHSAPGARYCTRVDITDAVKFGGDNVITVQTIRPTFGIEWSGYTRDLGITRDIYLECVPAADVEYVLVTPSVAKKALNVRFGVTNAGKDAVTLPLNAEVLGEDGNPALALWAGDNECDLAGSWYGIWRDPNENRLTRELLPGISRMLDPMRPYLASSPFISPQSWRLSREKKCDPMEFAAEQHLWGPRDFFKSDYYRNSRTSFTSETGFHGSPALDSIRKFIPEEHLALREDDEMWLYHASAPFLASSDQFTYRIPLMYKQIRNYFGAVPKTLAGFVQASQIVQAEALKYTIELHKQRPKRSGVLWWNLLDLWPQFSDAVIDYYGVRKLAYSFIQIVQNPLLGMISEAETAARSIIFANDTATDAEGGYTAEDVFSGEVLAAGSFHVSARSVTTAGAFTLDPAEKRLLCVRWKCADNRNGVNHNLTGQPAFDFAFYTQKVLPALARIYGTGNVPVWEVVS